MDFTPHEIENRDSLGYFLRKQREAQGYSLELVARKTLVAEHYLQYLEEGAFSYLPGELYFKNFLKRYVEFLGFTFEDVLATFRDELKFDRLWASHKPQARLPLAFSNFITWPKVMRATFLSLVALIIFGYLGFSAYKFLQPPELTITSPQDNIVIQEHTILVTGRTDPSAEIKINEQEIISEKGKFSQELDLQTGINDIEIVASKKHGRLTKVLRQVIVTDTPGDISKN